ncbi:MAG TPA: thioredoxin family protein [Thermoanaerobaculia bacterium]|nr:thioredoxin family protein [Thermoanaerobaculia bacterium]
MKHETTPTRRRAATFLLSVLATVGLVAPLLAQPSDALLRNFMRSGDYLLEVDGKAVPNAEIYQNNSIPAVLILTSSLSAPVLLNPRAGTVETVPIMKVLKKADGSADLSADAATQPQGEFQVVEGNAAFTLQGRKAVLKVRPSLLGLRRSADLKAYSPDYQRVANTYTPNAQALATLKKETRPVTVRTYFGSWCPHCREHVPLLMKVEDQLKGSPSKIKFEYMGLEKGLREPVVKQLGLKGVPTGIVLYNGKEIGRLNSDADWNAPEAALTRILAAAGKSASKGKK